MKILFIATKLNDVVSALFPEVSCMNYWYDQYNGVDYVEINYIDHLTKAHKCFNVDVTGADLYNIVIKVLETCKEELRWVRTS